MKRKKYIYILLVIIPFSEMFLPGCSEDKKPEIIESVVITNPADRVDQYIRLLYRKDKRDEAYRLLTTNARNQIPEKDFKSLVNGELSDAFAGRSYSEIDVRIEHLKDFLIDDNHRIIYSLVRISFPYDENAMDMFRLSRFHLYRQGDAWNIQPFIHRETFTIRLLPSLIVGYQKDLDKKRSEFYEIIGRDLLKERKDSGSETPQDKNAPDLGEAEKVGTLIVPDLRKKPDDSEIVKTGGTDSIEKNVIVDNVASLLMVGRLHYQVGNIAAAEKAFRRILEIDENNEAARNYLDKCKDIRRLQEEKKKQIELYEKLLELDEKESELESKSKEK